MALQPSCETEIILLRDPALKRRAIFRRPRRDLGAES